MPDRPPANAAHEPKGEPRGSAPLCFIVDEDFGVRQEISKEMRRLAIDVVEFSNSARLLGMVDSSYCGSSVSSKMFLATSRIVV